MSYTFSDNHEVDYPALGMCDTCGKRFTQGCEHSNTLEAQQWLAAYAATEQSHDNVEYFLETQKDNQPAAVTAYEVERTLGVLMEPDAWSDPRMYTEKQEWYLEDGQLDNGLTDDRPYRAGNTDGEMPL